MTMNVSSMNKSRHTWLARVLATACPTVLLLGVTSCSTVAGVVVSPITGGVDLTRQHLDQGGTKIGAPFACIGGVIAGPFAALWNGLRLDGGYVFGGKAESYWPTVPEVFQPFEMLSRHD